MNHEQSTSLMAITRIDTTTESHWNVSVPDTSQGSSFCRYFSYFLLLVSWLHPFLNCTWYLRSAIQLCARRKIQAYVEPIWHVIMKTCAG